MLFDYVAGEFGVESGDEIPSRAPFVLNPIRTELAFVRAAGAEKQFLLAVVKFGVVVTADDRVRNVVRLAGSFPRGRPAAS